MFNFLILINKIKDINLNKIGLDQNMDYMFIEYLNKNEVFNNLKQIEISISNLNLFVDLKIICPKVNGSQYFIDNDFNIIIKK